jgi:hypothetical protein
MMRVSLYAIIPLTIFSLSMASTNEPKLKDSKSPSNLQAPSIAIATASSVSYPYSTAELHKAKTLQDAFDLQLKLYDKMRKQAKKIAHEHQKLCARVQTAPAENKNGKKTLDELTISSIVWDEAIELSEEQYSIDVLMGKKSWFNSHDLTRYELTADIYHHMRDIIKKQIKNNRSIV